MGFWDVIYSVGDKLIGITPDLSTAKRAAQNYTSSAVNKIDQAVRVDGIQKLPHYLPDDETRAQIGLFTTTLAKHTGNYVVCEGFKHIPGATVAVKLVSDTMLEMKRENHKDGAKVTEAKMDRSEEDLKKSTSQPEISSQNNKSSSPDSHAKDGDGAGGGSRKNSEPEHKIISKI
ncbi:hypothetical protein L6452_28649 [Arctium lappa]|uniref:Uncharacterized protein n=1 Tax=Arctium lappa TaxID=4217 RepID=A0ACB9A019_ARCLA|nr:hypothetical protein L6452_28649 [Arctium lappa]